MATGSFGQCGAVDVATMDMVMLRCLQAERNREARNKMYQAVFQQEGLLNHQFTDLNTKYKDLHTRACATLSAAAAQHSGAEVHQLPQDYGAPSDFSSTTTMPNLSYQGKMALQNTPVQPMRNPTTALPRTSAMCGPPGLEHPCRTTFNGRYRPEIQEPCFMQPDHVPYDCEAAPTLVQVPHRTPWSIGKEVHDQACTTYTVNPVPNDVPIPVKLTIGTPPGLTLDNSAMDEASTDGGSELGSTRPKVLYEDKKLGSNRPMRAIEPGATTLLVRNVPSRYTHKDLLEEWADEVNNFDMVYRPYSLAMKRNLGHAVMNFVSHEAAIDFQIRYHGKRLKDHGRTRALDIAQSDVQGYEANLLVLRRKIATIKNETCLPVVLSNGQLLDVRQEVERVAARSR